MSAHPSTRTAQPSEAIQDVETNNWTKKMQPGEFIMPKTAEMAH
jgi:hypothetical protein